jgi:hemoglobin
MTLYEELGGDGALARVASEFYERAALDEITAVWFRRISDPEKFKGHLRAYLAVVLDGPEAYEGRSMRNAHSGLNITAPAFDAVLTRLGEAFAAEGMDPGLIAKVHARLQRLRAAIVG